MKCNCGHELILLIPGGYRHKQYNKHVKGGIGINACKCEQPVPRFEIHL